MLKVAGWAIAAAGLVVALVGALADQIGLGGEGPDKFAGKQVAALIAGLVILVAGLALALWAAARERRGDTTTAAPGEPM
jgi:Zn-dependent protease with chaperone function